MTDEQQPPLNREQRRARKFRSRSTARQDNLHTQRENDTGFLATPTETLADGPRDVALTGIAETPAARENESADLAVPEPPAPASAEPQPAR